MLEREESERPGRKALFLWLGCVRERFLDLRYQPKAKKVQIVSRVKKGAVRERFLNLENDIWSK